MRPSRLLLLALAGSVVLGLTPSGIALASDRSATNPTAIRSDGDAVPTRDSTTAAAYTARNRDGQAWIGGLLTVPTLGDCSDGDEGAFTGIELARGGVRYAAGGVYSSCVDGVPRTSRSSRRRLRARW